MSTFPKLQVKLNALGECLRRPCPAGDYHAKLEFFRCARSAFRDLYYAVGVEGGVAEMTPSDCIRVNPAGDGSAGDVYFHTDSVYLNVGEVAWFNMPYGNILIRSASGRKDYRGGPNQWLTLDEFLNADCLVAAVLRVSAEGRRMRLLAA